MHKRKATYKMYGGAGIDPGSVEQMDAAMSLPVAREGALMADAHLGYGLPIGGVLATENEVIPYGVGVDIGCRVALSVFPCPVSDLSARTAAFRDMLLANTRFGFAAFSNPADHEVLHRREFREIPALKDLWEKARSQIGSSGGGNHFVEFGIVELHRTDKAIDLPPGNYIGLLSHSGSRGFGAAVANYYTKVAMSVCPLPRTLKHLSWLELDSEEGQEYWNAMQLAGDYARANHQQIHDRMAKSLGLSPIAKVENHHNFAWKETDPSGNTRIVHRKGATPAAATDVGIIPGSMILPGFIVRGKGVRESLNSASHGAGRVMSRRKAKKTITEQELRMQLKTYGVDLTGGGLDEAPGVYKDIRAVMDAQKELVEVVGSFTPKIVRMCGDRRFAEVD